MEVSDNIFLGSLECAKNEEDLKQKGITHILTVGRLIPLFPQDFKYFVLEIDDMETSFILESFNSAIEFIHDALENDGKVLIHCVAGVSRSPTIYLAYQMQKEHLEYDSALRSLQVQYPTASPNSGFEEQLRLFAEMGWQIDENSVLFRRYRLGLWGSRILATGEVSMDVYAEDPATMQLPPSAIVVTCRKCSRRLFTDANIVGHALGEGQTAFSWQRREGGDPSRRCTSEFVEPMRWMGELEANEGKITCPKCASRLGSYHWSGSQCSCGQWVTPAFQIPRSKIDIKTPIKLR